MQDINNDFNPFDLSAPPKPKEAPPAETEAPNIQPTVKRVSMGPLFHSRITKLLALVLGIILAALIGYTAVNFYLNNKADQAISVNVIK